MAKNQVSGPILVHLAYIQTAKTFFQKSGCQSLDNMVINHHVQCQKKLMIQSWEILVTDRRTDGRTEGGTRVIS